MSIGAALQSFAPYVMEAGKSFAELDPSRRKARKMELEKMRTGLDTAAATQESIKLQNKGTATAQQIQQQLRDKEAKIAEDIKAWREQNKNVDMNTEEGQAQFTNLIVSTMAKNGLMPTQNELGKVALGQQQAAARMDAGQRIAQENTKLQDEIGDENREEQQAFDLKKTEMTQDFQSDENEKSRAHDYGLLAAQQSYQKQAEADANQADALRQNIEDTVDLRKEYNGLKTVKDFNDQKSSYARIAASANQESAAGDLALIFNYMKLLDPGSVVRESEFKVAEQAKSWLDTREDKGLFVPNAVRSAIQKVNTGERLLPEQRADFVSTAQNIFERSKENIRTVRQPLVQTAQRLGVAPDEAFGSLDSPEAEEMINEIVARGTSGKKPPARNGRTRNRANTGNTENDALFEEFTGRYNAK